MNIELDKELQRSDWSESLSPEQIQYAAQDPAVLLPLYQKLKETANDLNLVKVFDIENRTLPAIVWMECSGVNFEQAGWKALGITASGKVDELKNELNALVAESFGQDSLFGKQAPSINWDSTVQVLATLKKPGLPVDNTRQETLEQVKEQHPIIPSLLAYREAAKRLGTYGTNWNKYVHAATGRIHPDWRQLGAETGRMSCKNPNLQNLPRERAYRECFRAAPGNVLIKADYSQIELRLAAEIAGDSKMVEAFQKDQDLHVLAAMSITGKTNPSDINPEERQLAKAVNFGLVYGMGAKRLGEHARNGFGVTLTQAEATRIRNLYFKAFPGLRAWHHRQGNQTSTRTVLGRPRYFNGESPYTQLLNSPVSGSGADGLKLALARLWETRGSLGAFPVLAVHDELVVEAPAEGAESAREWLTHAMVEGMKECLKEVPVEVEISIRESW